MEKLNDYFKARKVVVKESVRLVGRDSKKYTKMVVGLWLMPLIIRGTEMAKDAYFFMRHVDDALDGDLYLREDPLMYVEDIRKGVINKDQSNNPVCVLAERSLKILKKRQKIGDDPKKDFLDGIDGMVRDHKRMQTREVLLGDDFKQNYINSFSPHHNISLIGVESSLRSRDIEIFSYCQGLAYGIQDFDTDWQRGLVNIPREILEMSGMTVEHPLGEIKFNPVVKEWVDFESSRSRVSLGNFLEEVNSLNGEKEAKILINSLSRKVVNILENPIF
jgi:hypothetical protein